MNLDEVEGFFRDAGLPLRWLVDPNSGTQQRLVPPAGTQLQLTVDTAVVIPDVHLGIGRNDSFQEGVPARADRLERFLGVLTALRDHLGAANFAAVQLGDFYDLLREFNHSGNDFATRLDAIRTTYDGIARRASSLPLLHCIGNHDNELYANRGLLQARGISAHVVRALSNSVVCIHGNDLASLLDVELDVEVQQWFLSLFQSVITMPALGPIAGAIQRLADDSLVDPIFENTNQTSEPWPPANPAYPAPRGWSAPWVNRDKRIQLGEPLRTWGNALGVTLRVVIMGHSHRPGISWTVLDGRDPDSAVPLVDVGSWTYGRSQFAVVCADGIGLADLGPL